MKRAYYETPKASKTMRLFWKIAGGDEYLLNKATYSDQLKYTTLGGIVLATGAMAALAGGYAFYTIFSPKSANVLDKTKTLIESASYTPVDIPTLITSIIFGLIWGLIIFNIDRFIVTSTGKGDGTEKITWDEIKSAIPRIIMGLIISITISKPIEIRMFQTEIDLEVSKEQEKEKKSLIIQANNNFDKKVESLKPKIDYIEKSIENKRSQAEDLRNEIKNEITGKNHNGAAYGPRAEELERQAVIMEDEIKSLENKSDYKTAKKDFRKYEVEKEKDIIAAEIKGASLDGLLIRIKKAHDLDFWISLFITLLFMAIELTPIFFKLMLIKSTYDFMDENVKELIKADSGILVEYDYYPDKEGSAKDLVIHIEKEKQMIEQRELLELQKRLTKYAIEKYEDSMKLKIDENPSKFITSQHNEA